ncbi:MAG: hypothetical protein ACI8WB_002281 [Phenylobacterium sp.]|jgi:hypothetical protein
MYQLILTVYLNMYVESKLSFGDKNFLVIVEDRVVFYGTLYCLN